ncbi:MAG TPA: FecR family protein [Dongiaceae bacterium]|nr:FecR family protein [Dongiaceae bacterium]
MPDSELRDEEMAALLKLAGRRPEPPDAARARVRAAVHSDWRAAIAPARRRNRRWLAVAAAFILLAGGGLFLARRGEAPQGPVAAFIRIDGEVRAASGAAAPEGSIAPGATVVTGPGGRAAIQLAGGASLRLDADTEVRFDGADRLTLGRGALYLDSGSESGRAQRPALEIGTPLGKVTDIGTQFEVRLDAGALRVQVRRGLARLTRGDRSVTAGSGSRIEVATDGTTRVVPLAADDDADWDWVQQIAPPFDIEGRGLDRYLDWLARETGWRVEFADPAVAADAPGILMHGSIAGIRPDRTPEIVLPACGLAAHREGRVLRIERPREPGDPR